MFGFNARTIRVFQLRAASAYTLLRPLSPRVLARRGRLFSPQPAVMRASTSSYGAEVSSTALPMLSQTWGFSLSPVGSSQASGVSSSSSSFSSSSSSSSSLASAFEINLASGTSSASRLSSSISTFRGGASKRWLAFAGNVRAAAEISLGTSRRSDMFATPSVRSGTRSVAGRPHWMNSSKFMSG